MPAVDQQIIQKPIILTKGTKSFFHQKKLRSKTTIGWKHYKNWIGSAFIHVKAGY